MNYKLILTILLCLQSSSLLGALEKSTESDDLYILPVKVNGFTFPSWSSSYVSCKKLQNQSLIEPLTLRNVVRVRFPFTPYDKCLFRMNKDKTGILMELYYDHETNETFYYPAFCIHKRKDSKNSEEYSTSTLKVQKIKYNKNDPLLGGLVTHHVNIA